MGSHDPHVEVLVNRYLDGEITARELERLRGLMDTDDQARELFEQMLQLDRACQDAVQTHILQTGRPVEDLIANAWEGHNTHAWTGKVTKVVFSQFTYGLAAGLLLAVSLYLVLTSLGSDIPAPARMGQPTIVRSNQAGPVTSASMDDSAQEDSQPQVNVYYYRDSQGNLWAIPALSEQRVLTATDQRVF